MTIPKRKILQIMPAPVDADGLPVFRVARPFLAFDGVKSVYVNPVIAWALCERPNEDEEIEQVIEPVFVSDDNGEAQVATTHTWEGPVDAVLAPNQKVVGIYDAKDGNIFAQTEFAPAQPNNGWTEDDIDFTDRPRLSQSK